MYPHYLINHIVKTYLNNDCCPKENDSTEKVAALR